MAFRREERAPAPGLPAEEGSKEGYRDGMQGLFRGGPLTLKVARSPRHKRVGVSRRGDILHLQAGLHHRRGELEAALARWYRKEARRVLTERVKEYAALMGVTYKKVFIKDQKTRWGSCSRQGNLNFNFRLVMAPDEILTYLVVHELCHRVHPNHSKAYWALVESYYPRCREARKWLREQGSALQGELFKERGRGKHGGY